MVKELMIILSLMRFGNMFSEKDIKNALIKRNLISDENKKDELKVKIIIYSLKKNGLISQRIDDKYSITANGKTLLGEIAREEKS